MNDFNLRYAPVRFDAKNGHKEEGNKEEEMLKNAYKKKICLPYKDPYIHKIHTYICIAKHVFAMYNYL